MVNVNQIRANAPGFDPRLFLRDEELDYGIALLLAGERVLMKAAREIAGDHAMPMLAARTLITIRFQPGQSVNQLRDQMDATTPTFARIIADLDRLGLVERRRTEQGDRRTRQLYLSHEGKRLTDPATIAMRDRLRRAYRAAGSGAVGGARTVLEALL
ncbi:MAG: MarR family winged helix-turn-helix transcriptional regulator [Hyphomonadaceae bacterium]|nr:MarR family winged helix-turn-helix transcriptional regulator [Hyphomonadaceae bacterium]